MKNLTYLVLIMVLVVGGFMFVNGKNGTANAVLDGSQVIQGQMQKVVLSQEGLNYKDAVVEEGKSISLSADSSVGGCLRSVVFNLNGKKYSKYLRNPEDTLKLPALSKGTYNFACSMGMGYGKLIVQ